MFARALASERALSRADELASTRARLITLITIQHGKLIVYVIACSDGDGTGCG